MDFLPAEIEYNIFGLLDASDLTKLLLLNKEWNIRGIQYVSRSVIGQVPVVYSDNGAIKIQTKSQKQSNIVISSLRYLKQLDAIESINFYEIDEHTINLSNKMIFLAQMSNLTSLGFQSTKHVNDSTSKQLSMISALRSLDLTRADKIDFRCAPKNLETLLLAYWSYPDPSSFEPIWLFTKLKHLDLTECYAFEDQCVRYLSTLESLETLIMDNCGVTGSGFQELCHLNLSNLQRFLFTEDDDTTYNVSTFQYVTRFTALTCLYIHLPENGFPYLTSLTNLEELFLTCITGSINEDIKQISTLRNLNQLAITVDNNNVSFDILMNALGELGKLENLWLYHCHTLQSCDFKYMTSLTNLSRLQLERASALTPNDLLQLSILTNLHYLKYSNNHPIFDTPEIKQKFPTLIMEHTRWSIAYRYNKF